MNQKRQCQGYYYIEVELFVKSLKCVKQESFTIRGVIVSDLDECQIYSGQICSINAQCENTPGSYRCECKEGFLSSNEGRTCEGSLPFAHFNIS